MMYIAMNRFRVAPDKQEAFMARWLDREVLLRTVPGFVSFQFLKGPASEDYVLYASHTVWASEEPLSAGQNRSSSVRRTPPLGKGLS